MKAFLRIFTLFKEIVNYGFGKNTYHKPINNSPNFHIAIKYFLGLKKRNIVNIITLISMIGVLFGTMAMIIVLSVFNGFDDIIQNLYKNLDADVKIELNEGTLFEIDDTIKSQLNSLEGIISWSEVLEHQMLAKSSNFQSVVNIKGVDENYTKVTNIKSEILLGEYFKTNSSFLIVTNSVFHNLSLKLLDFETPLNLTYFSPSNNMLDPMNQTKTKNFYVSGVFKSQVDMGGGDVILSIEKLRDFLKLNKESTSIVVNIDPQVNFNKIKSKLKLCFGEEFIFKNRFQQRPFINKMIKSEKLVVYIMFTFILIISMLSLIASLVVLLMQKKKDIKIFQSLGFKTIELKKIFFKIGVMITSLGLILGVSFGIGFTKMQEKFHILKLGTNHTFFINHYPVKIQELDIVVIIAIVLTLGCLTSYIVTSRNIFYK